MKPLILTDYEVLLAAACLTNTKRLLLEKMPYAPAGIDARNKIDEIASRIRDGRALDRLDIECRCGCIENVRRLARKDYNIPAAERAKLQRGCEQLQAKLNGALPDTRHDGIRQNNVSEIVSGEISGATRESDSPGPAE
jgi:hypothetical protein